MPSIDGFTRRPHSVSKLHAHYVFVVKYRRRVFTAAMMLDLLRTFEEICAEEGSELQQMDGEADHVHLLVRHPPNLRHSDLVRRLKSVSSRRLRQTYPQLVRRFRKPVLWSPSYFVASCGGAPIGIIRQYIERQETPR